MEMRKMERLGVEASLLGYGCMRLPVREDGKIDEEKATALLEKGLANGINYIDTAYPYHNGESESFVGKVLKNHPRDSFYLATKMPSWEIHKVEDVDRIFAIQLDRLQTNYVDFYLIHAIGRDKWRELVSLGVVEHLEQMQKDGKIKYLGFSFHDSYEAFEEIINYRDWDFCQIQLNYMDVNEQAGMKGYELATKKGVPLVIMEPVKGGSLASFADDIMEKFNKVRPGASAASFALRFLGSLPGIKVILSGMTTMEQLDDNLKTFSPFEPLSKEEQDVITEVVDLMNSRIQNGCTGCRYCMPCPAGVNIPGCFKAWNTYHMFQNYNVVKMEWERFIGPTGQAKNCVECGKCEKACPQKLSIREDLKKVQADLDKKEMIL